MGADEATGTAPGCVVGLSPDPARDVTPPVIDAFSPSVGSTIAHDDTITFHVTDDGEVSLGVVAVEFSDGTAELIFDGTDFTTPYAGSTVTPITDGAELTIARAAGWRGPNMSLFVYIIDAGGNIATGYPFAFSVSDPVTEDTTPPEVGEFSPPVGSTIAHDDTITFDVTDDVGLSPIAVGFEFPGLPAELVFDGDALQVGYTGSTVTPISGGYRYTLSRAAGWPTATMTLFVQAIDTAGNVGGSLWYVFMVSDPVGGGAGDTTPPVIDNFDPIVGSTIAHDDSITFEVTDNLDELAHGLVAAEFTGGAAELIFTNDASFSTAYAGSTVTPIANGYRFEIVRAAGWLGPDLTLRAYAIDEDGNAATPTSYAFTVSDPVLPDTTAPVVSNVSPTAGTELARTDPVFFDVTDDSATFRRILVTASFEDGVAEVVHDGDSFAARYAATSTRTPIASGYRYRVRRTGGWPYGPTIRAYAIDTSGNENT